MATYREVHCWEDMAEETGEFDGNGPLTLNYTCLLLQGHDGDHEFTLDSEIAIRFTDAGGVDGAEVALAIDPKVFDGPPPPVLVQDPVSNDYLWACECGDQGVSSNKEWAHSDVNRHRQREHPDTNGDIGLHDNAINEWADQLFGGAAP